MPTATVKKVCGNSLSVVVCVHDVFANFTLGKPRKFGCRRFHPAQPD